MRPSTLEIGTTPFDLASIRAALGEFEELYKERPVKDNYGGMKAPHLFATWYMVRALQPKYIIESGILKGQSTWLLEQACPEAEVHSIDLNLSNREYISKTATYYDDDFSEIDWSALDPEQTLVFFDDHQNSYKRLQQCHWFGFRQLIFEDNYPEESGDFYSLRMILGKSGFGNQDEKSAAEVYSKISSKMIRRVKSIVAGWAGGNRSIITQHQSNTVKANSSDRHFLIQRLENYWEFPPVTNSVEFPDSEPLLNDEEAKQFPLFVREASHYNGICFVLIKKLSK